MTTRSVIVRLRAEMAQFKKEWNDGTSAVKGTRDELGKASKQSKQTSQDIDKTGTSVGKMSKNLRDNRQEWDLVGTSLLRSGLALTAVSALMTKAAIDWETAWAGVTKTVNGTDAELAAVEQGLRSLAKTMPESHTQIAAVAEAAGQLGIATGDVVDFTRVMVMLGDTTNLSADEAATSIAQLMNVMQTAPEDVDRLGATLVALGNSGASTERDIIQMAQRIAGAGEIVGLTEANVLGLANALASSGIEVEAGGSAISRILIDISKDVATNSDGLRTWAKVAGMSADEFATKWKADPATALADFTEGLGRMADNGENVFGMLDQLGQSDIRVTRALLNMANAGDLLRNSLSEGDVAWERNNALTDEAGKRYDTTAAKAKIAWNNIKDNAIDAGQGMLPVVSAISDVVVQLAEAFGALSAPVKAGLGVLAGGTGVALLTVGAFMKVIGTATDLHTALGKLEIKAPRTGRALATAGKAAGILATALIAVDASANLFNATDIANVEKFTGALLELSEGGYGAAKTLESLASRKAGSFLGVTITGDIKSLSDAIDTLDASKWEKFLNSGFGQSKIDLAGDAISQIDASLTSLVQSGAIDEAAAGFDYYASQADKVGVSSKKALAQLPGYSEALEGISNEGKLAAKSAGVLAGESDRLAARLAELSPDADEARKMLDDLEQSTIDAALGFLDLSNKIDTSKTSFDGWLKDLEAQHRAMEDWADNLIKASQRGVSEGVIKEFERLGPEGAKRLAQLVDASDEEIARLNKVFSSGSVEAQRLAEILNALPSDVITEFKTPGADDAIKTATEVAVKYNLAPDQVETILKALDYASDDIDKVLEGLGVVDGKTVTAEMKVIADNAKAVIQEVLNLLGLFRGKSVTLNTMYTSNNPTGKTGRTRAEGGPIDGVGGPKQDNILIAASVGEHMWTAQEVANAGGHGAMYAWRAQARAGKRPKFVSGGAVDDAWNESYRSAAAAYGNPVQSMQALPSSTDFSTLRIPAFPDAVSLTPESSRRLAADLASLIGTTADLRLGAAQRSSAGTRSTKGITS